MYTYHPVLLYGPDELLIYLSEFDLLFHAISETKIKAPHQKLISQYILHAFNLTEENSTLKQMSFLVFYNMFH